MMYGAPTRARLRSFQTLLTRWSPASRYSRVGRTYESVVTIVSPTGHSFDNAQRPRARDKDRRETKETGKSAGNGLTRFTALD